MKENQNLVYECLFCQIKSKKCSNLVLGKGKRQNIHYFGHTVIPEIWAKFSILSICSFKINHDYLSRLMG